MADYYISASSGSDTTGDGSQGNPYRTWIANFSGKYAVGPGDNIYFKRDDKWIGKDGNVVIVSSGSPASPVTLSVWGSGAMPMLIGDSATTTGWVSKGVSSIYMLTNYNPTSIYVVTQQDTMALGRWRGSTSGLAEGTYITTLNTLCVHLWGNSNPATSIVRVGSFRGAGGEFTGLLDIRSAGCYVEVNSLQVVCVNGIGITAAGSSNTFKDCVMIGAGRDGVQAIAYLPNRQFAYNFRWFRGEVCYSSARGTGFGQGFTVNTVSSWVVKAMIQNNFMAGLDFLDYGVNTTNCAQSGAAWCTIRNNSIWNDSSAFDPNLYIDGANNIYIYGNIVSAAGVSGKTNATANIRFGSESPENISETCSAVWIVNNLVYRGHWKGLDAANQPSFPDNISSIRIYNNTVIGHISGGFDSVFAYGDISTANGVFQRNNVFVFGTPSNMLANIYAGTAYTTALDSDYNCFFNRNSSNNIFRSGDSSPQYYTLANWVSQSAGEDNSISASPQYTYVSDTVPDVHADPSSPIIGMGTQGGLAVPAWLPADVFPFGGGVRGVVRADGVWDFTGADLGYHYLSDQAQGYYPSISIGRSAKVTIARDAKLQLQAVQ